MSVPFYGEKFTFTQPDGSKIQVRGWGNQNHAVFETLDGYTVLRNPVDGFYDYAKPGSDNETLEPSGVHAGTVSPESLGLETGLRFGRAAAKARAQAQAVLPPLKSQWRAHREKLAEASRSTIAASATSFAPPRLETVGRYIGLCLLIRFPGEKARISPQEVERFCNLVGYTGFGNKGSVRDYFHDVSNGKVTYTCLVAPYYKAKHRKSYYTNPKIPYGERARELIKEALDSLKKSGYDFSSLSSDSDNDVYALNVLYNGKRVNEHKNGLWPHSASLAAPYPLTASKNAFNYQISDIGTELRLGPFCHENGHLLCDFPDLYDVAQASAGITPFGAGYYCLMGTGSLADPKNPTQVCAYLKYRAGWARHVMPVATLANVALVAGSNDFYLANKSATEYYIIENRWKGGRDEALPDAGLAIWHVDELGSNENDEMTPASHYECALIQADDALHLEYGDNPGDDEDLFEAGNKDQFSGSTRPSAAWWDGSPCALDIYNIGPAGQTITFSIKT